MPNGSPISKAGSKRPNNRRPAPGTRAGKPGPGRREIERPRLLAAVAPDHPARPAFRAGRAEVGVAPGEIERHPLAQRNRNPGRRHPGQPRPGPARHRRRGRRKGHGRLSDPGAHDADAGADEGRQRARLRQPQRTEVDETGQHPRHGGQVRRDRLPPLRRQEVGAAPEREGRTILDQRLEPRRAGGVAQPEPDRRHRPERAGRPVGRTVAAGAAAVERRRRRTGAVLVHECRVARPVEPEAAAQVDFAGRGGAGGEPHSGCNRQGRDTAVPRARAVVPAQHSRAIARHSPIPNRIRTPAAGLFLHAVPCPKAAAAGTGALTGCAVRHR